MSSRRTPIAHGTLYIKLLAPHSGHCIAAAPQSTSQQCLPEVVAAAEEAQVDEEDEAVEQAEHIESQASTSLAMPKSSSRIDPHPLPYFPSPYVCSIQFIAVKTPYAKFLFQVYEIVPPKPLSAEEKRSIAHYRALREKMHAGPYYAVLGEDVRVGKGHGMGTPAAKAAPSFDPFEGMETYGQRYLQKARRAPRLDPQKFAIEFFPSELWSAIDPSYDIPKKNTEQSATARPKTLGLPIHAKAKGKGRLLEAQPSVADADDAEQAEAKDDDDEEEGGAKPKGDDEDSLPVEEAEVDDDYEEDEEEVGDDYNAEQYFDDGGEDGGDDYEGGDGGDGGDF